MKFEMKNFKYIQTLFSSNKMTEINFNVFPKKGDKIF